MPAPCQVASSLLDLIGVTPIVRLRKLPGPHDAEVWGKLESLNPGGSVKDRICLNMIEAAEQAGQRSSAATGVARDGILSGEAADAACDLRHGVVGA